MRASSGVAVGDALTTSKYVLRLQNLIWRVRLTVPLSITACSVELQALDDAKQSKEEGG